MSDDDADAPSFDSSPTPSTPSLESIQRANSAIQSLSTILGSIPDSLSTSSNPAFDLLNNPIVASAVTRRFRRPNSGAGDDNLCRWLYDTFQSTDPSLHLAVLRFLPTVAGLYLSRCTGRRHYQPLAGFEAVLLALYAHETVARDGNPVTINLPNLSAPHPYQESKISTTKNSNKNAEDPVFATALLSQKLEPHGTMRSTRRARVVGVALELYFNRISSMPSQSKLEFCHFASVWAGEKKEESKKEEEECGEKGERIPLPWELLQPTLRILGHCLLHPTPDEELKTAALAAVKRLQDRAMHDMSTQAILATRSLVRLGTMTETAYEPLPSSLYSEVSDSESTKITA